MNPCQYKRLYDGIVGELLWSDWGKEVRVSCKKYEISYVRKKRKEAKKGEKRSLYILHHLQRYTLMLTSIMSIQSLQSFILIV